MCEPTTLALTALAIGTVGTAYQFEQQRRAASQQRDNARQQFERDQAALDAQAQQQSAADSEAMSERHRQALIEQGRIRAAAGESGLNDNGRIEAESYFNEGQDIAAIQNNDQSAQAQIIRQRGAALGNMQSAINMAGGPSLFGAGLQIAGVGLNSAATYRSYNKTKPQVAGASNTAVNIPTM